MIQWLTMNIQHDQLTDTKVKLTISLDKTELDDASKVALHKLARTVKAPGFRKGKVPASVAAKYIDPNQLAQETVDNALSKAVAEAFSSKEIRALERPQVEVTKFVPGETLEFTAEAEIIPNVTLGDYKKLKAPKQDEIKISDEQVSEVIERIRTQLASKKAVARAAKDGDEVSIDFVGKKDGTPFDGGAGTNYALTLGSKSFIPGFEEGVIGHKAGDEFDLTLSFPKDYHVKDLAGQEVVFSVTLHEVKGVELPGLNDELAAKAGPFTSVKELEDDIRRELTARAEAEQRDQLRDALVSQLVEKSTVPVPEVLRADQLQSIEQDMTQNLMYQGMTLDTWLGSKGYKDKDEWIKKEAGPLADQRVQAGLVLSELSKVANVTATNQELAERIEALKAQYAKQPDMIKQLDQPEVQRDIANRLLTEKTIDMLVAQNTKK